ncbi:MAG: alpha/beta hydrolase [Cyclobacteriaceae bacterium]|nr:alpha/beta hydrolase [Cyclobacteriaceae bacterium]
MQKELTFQFKARYVISAPVTHTTKHIWFVLHGYGQLAEYFIRKFDVIQNEETTIIAPEGLSRFYLQEVTTRTQTGNNKVGATWMTKENRLTDIENYLNYLTKIYDTEVPADYIGKITLLGFSQGAATASRWAADNRIRFDRLILWAGIFPPDMEFDKAGKLLQHKEVVEVYGTNDPFLTDARLKEMTQLNQQLGLNPTVITFDGQHELNATVLKKISNS